MLKFKYSLTTMGKGRCLEDKFYLQNTPDYRGYTEKIFRLLHNSQKPLTAREISNLTGINTRSLSGIISFNVYAGYIKRVPA